jgi:SAM-dependent methyltransferase
MKKIFKIISVVLCVLMAWPGMAVPSPHGTGANTLQPELLFSPAASGDAFFQLMSGYLSFYLAEAENMPELRNIPRLKQVVDETLTVLKGLEAIPSEFRDKLPSASDHYPESASIIIDLGENKIRYFDHNVPGAAAVPEAMDLKVAETHVGRYLSRQVLRSKVETEKEKKVTDSGDKSIVGSLKRGVRKVIDKVKDLRGASVKAEQQAANREKALEEDIVFLVRQLAGEGIEMSLPGMRAVDLHKGKDIIKSLEAYCVLKDKKALRYLLGRRLEGKDIKIFDSVFNARKRLIGRKQEGKDPLRIVHVRGGRGSAPITEEIRSMAENGLVDLKIIPGAVDDGRSFADMALYFNATGVPDMGKCHCNMGTDEAAVDFAGMRLIEGEAGRMSERDAVSLLEELVEIMKEPQRKPSFRIEQEVQIGRLMSGFNKLAGSPEKQIEIITSLEAFISMAKMEFDYKGNVIDIRRMPMRSILLIGARTRHSTWQDTLDSFGRFVDSAGRVILPTDRRLHAMAILEDGTLLPTENAINEFTGKKEYYYFTVGPRSFAEDLMFELLYMASGKTGMTPTARQREAVEALRTREVTHLDKDPERYRIRLFSPSKHKRIVREFLEHLDRNYSYQAPGSGAEVFSEAIEAVKEADAIFSGPTDIESNIASAVIYDEISSAIRDNPRAAKILIANSADRRGVEPENTTTSSQLERLYRYLSDQQRYKVGAPDRDNRPVSDYVNYVVGRARAFRTPEFAIPFDEAAISELGSVPIGLDLELTGLGDEKLNGPLGAEYYRTPEEDQGAYNSSITVDTMLALSLLKEEGVTPEVLVWESRKSMATEISDRKVPTEIWSRARRIVDHYRDESNLSSSEKRHTPQGYLYAPSASEVVLKLADKFISGRDTRVLDMGYGAGKACALFSLFSEHVTGVEIDAADAGAGKAEGLAEAGIARVDDLASRELIDRQRIKLEKGDYLSDEFDFSGYDMVYLYWPYKTEDSKEYASRIAGKLRHPEKGLKDGAVFAVYAPSGEARNVFISEFERVDIRYESWEDERSLGRVVFAFRKKTEDNAGLPEEDQDSGGENAGSEDVPLAARSEEKVADSLSPARPYATEEAREILEKWRVFYGANNVGLIDIYYDEESLRVPLEDAGYTPQGAIHGQTDIDVLADISEKFISGKDAKVLDAGSGSGKAVAVFAQYADHVTGVEIDSGSRSGTAEDRLFEIGKERIEFLAGEGIVDRDKITLTDEDFLDPGFDLSKYDVVYHYWTFDRQSSGEYMKKFNEKLTDPEKGLKTGGIFILNSLLKEVSFPGLEKVNVDMGNNVTVYRRVLAAPVFPEALYGMKAVAENGDIYGLEFDEEKDVISIEDKEGKTAGHIRLSMPGGIADREVRIEEVQLAEEMEGKGIKEAVTRVLGNIIPEGYIVSEVIRDKDLLGYLENIYAGGEGASEQNILRGYDPAACSTGRLYMGSGFNMQVVRVKESGGLREYMLIAFRSEEPYEYRKAVNMLIKRQFSKWGKGTPHLSLAQGGAVYSVRISLLADPSEQRLRNNIFATVSRELVPGSDILSVGVGTGVFEEMFVANGYSVTGVDITPEVLDVAAGKGIKTIEADAGNREFWEKKELRKKYSAILFSESLEYFDEPEKIFSMAKSVLAENGKIYIVSRNIPGNRREEKYEQALKEAGYSISSGSGHLFFGANAGVRLVAGEKREGDADRKEDIVRRAEETVPRLVHHMMSLSSIFSPGAVTEEDSKKTVLLVDKGLSRLNGDGDVARSMKRLIYALAGVKSNNERLADFLRGLEIIPVEAKDMGAGSRFSEYKNIIAVTSVSNRESFENINNGIIVAAIEDKAFPENAYLPLIEVTLFAIGKYLNLGPEVLKRYYMNIPLVKSIEELADSGELYDIFDPSVRSFVIQLPHAENFDASSSLVETIEIVREILQKA